MHIVVIDGDERGVGVGTIVLCRPLCMPDKLWGGGFWGLSQHQCDISLSRQGREMHMVHMSSQGSPSCSVSPFQGWDWWKIVAYREVRRDRGGAIFTCVYFALQVRCPMWQILHFTGNFFSTFW